ncbi:regulatory protein Cox [Escherichia coli M056]|uniref:Cox family DNA-binding protein n=1 Tax=Escherichia coli TaxID=562 RepID=UPI000A187AC8|nr:Cox family DNA-binding protein [Escherichia coli]OSK24210.1 regulatory protein Cox [Escherichia coli M056]
MEESELEGLIQVVPYPLEAVPYQMFAKMIGRSESRVRTMVDSIKLPTIDFTKPGTVKGRASENWVYLPAFNAGMRKAFFEQPKERRDAWLLWLGL